MNSELNFWHERFKQQVGWSLPTRRFIFEQLSVPKSAEILEVGCGTGALLDSLHEEGYKNSTGVDIALESLIDFKHSDRSVCGDASSLPFDKQTFDLAICHYLLLWASDPKRAIQEMARVTKPGGWILSLSEPDYGSRIDLPYELIPLGELQTKSLQKQGANPLVGRKVQSLFRRAGLMDVRSGIIGAVKQDKSSSSSDRKLEWQVLEKDLQGTISEQEIKHFQELDSRAWRDGTRVQYVPVFYTYGRAAG